MTIMNIYILTVKEYMKKISTQSKMAKSHKQGADYSVDFPRSF